MVFPIEAEPRAKRRALSLCQDHLRKVVEVARKTAQIIDAFIAGDLNTAARLYEEVQRLSDEVADSKRAITHELIEIGAILLNRDDFLRFTYVISEIAELCKGISFRVLAIIERKWDVPPNIKEGIAELSGAVFNTMMKLREAVLALNYGSPHVDAKTRDVDMSEREVDNLYRKLELMVLEMERKMDISTMLLIRDIIQMLEDTADKIEDASDATRIVVLAL